MTDETQIPEETKRLVNESLNNAVEAQHDLMDIAGVADFINEKGPKTAAMAFIATAVTINNEIGIPKEMSKAAIYATAVLLVDNLENPVEDQTH